MNKYAALKNRHQKEFNEFPMFFAFSEKQFSEEMERLGLDPEKDTDKIYHLPKGGGFIKRSDANKFAELLEKLHDEFQEAIDADKTGEGFIYDMFCYELANHEYIITGCLSDTLDALGLTEKEVAENEKLWRGLQKAREDYLKASGAAERI